MMQEEKKEGPWLEDLEVARKEEGFGSAGLESDDDPDLHDLPKELRGLRDQAFEFEDELQSLLVSRGFGDLSVVLDPNTKKARFRMTSGAHDEVTREYTADFNEDWKGLAKAADGTCNIFIQPLPGRAITRRKPDIAFWGPAKCTTVVRPGRPNRLRIKHLVLPPMIHSKTREQIEVVNPDIVFQFSWGNGEGYEVEAINDMMNRALVAYPHAQPDNSSPNLGFLIKVRTKAKRNAAGHKIIRGVDVYRLPRGTTFADAKANRHGATHVIYTPGQADVTVEVTAQDLGIPAGNVPAPPPPFQISVADICNNLQV
jgi:hypothetical protein